LHFLSQDAPLLHRDWTVGVTVGGEECWSLGMNYNDLRKIDILSLIEL
jgi:hypothetical protein